MSPTLVRYVSLGVLKVALAVTGVVMTIFTSMLFIRLLSKTASGELGANLLFELIGYELLSQLPVVVPMGFFLAVILSYGKLYADHEMTVIQACGVDYSKLLMMALLPSFLIMAVMAGLTLVLSPWSERQAAVLLEKQRASGSFDALVAGRFQALPGGDVVYFEKLSEDSRTLENVFIVRQIQNSDGQGVRLLNAGSGELTASDRRNRRYLILQDGYQHDLQPGQQALRRVGYQQYGLMIEGSPIRLNITAGAAIKTGQLIGSRSTVHRAQLQWRISLILMIPILVLLAVPLSKVNPRQGQFVRCLPSFLLFVFYMFSLITLTKMVETKRFPLTPGLWSLHGLFFALGYTLYSWESRQKLPFSGRRQRSEGAV